MAPHIELRDHTETHHTRYGSGGVISPTQRPLPDKTQHSQETDAHAPGGIRSYNPKRRGTADGAATGSANRLYRVIILSHIYLLALPVGSWDLLT
jgi:hypothetical protein